MYLYVLALEATLLLGLWLTLAVWQLDRTSPARGTFVALGISSLLFGLGELSSVRALMSEVAADRVKYLGACAAPALWVGVAAHAAGLEAARRFRWFPLILMSGPLCLWGLLWSEQWSPLYLTTVPGGVDIYGPLWSIGTLYGYALTLTGSGLMLATAFRWRQPSDWSRRIAVGIAPLVPLAGNAFYLWGDWRFPYDPTPLLMVVAMLALRSAIFAGSLLRTGSLSQQELIQQLPLGVVLADRSCTVLDMNPAAVTSLGVTREEAVGRSLVALLDESEDVTTEVVPVVSGNHEVGQLVLIDWPGKRKGS